MAIGEKFPVVMGTEKAATNGIATLDENGILSENQRPSASDLGVVPVTRKINDKTLGENINLTADDVGARSSNWMPTADDILMPDGETTVSTALSKKVPILQTVPMITLTGLDMTEGTSNNGTIELRRIGNIVFVNFNFFTANDMLGEYTFATLPEGYHPNNFITFPMSIGSTGKAAYTIIRPDGICFTATNIESGYWLSACITYCTDSL